MQSDLRRPQGEGIRRLGRYQIIGRLATGGMAEIYLALSGVLPGFRTLVVVKRILPHLSSNSQFIRMFLDEARLAALLDHPNIVRIIEVGQAGEDYFLAMELVQGKPLSAVLRKSHREKKSPMPALSAYVLAQAARGLSYAHGLTDGDGRPLGVVHRDVSPQNVLISFEGAIKLIDFGVARAYGRVAHTSPGGLKGKIDYMSPEQASAEDVDHRADVFALGVVLWEAMTGKRLFRRETELATMRAIVDDPIPSPSEVAEVPSELEAIVMRALQKRRDARFPNADELAVALEGYAFSTPGFSPALVPAFMKQLFTSEFQQWRRTATAALDLAVEPGPDSGATGAPLATFAEPATHGPTMALRPGGPWVEGRGSDAQSGENHASTRTRGSRSQSRPQPESRSGASRSQASVVSTASSVPSRGDRLWVYGGFAIVLTIVATGVWVFRMPAVHVHRPAATPALAAPPSVAVEGASSDPAALMAPPPAVAGAPAHAGRAAQTGPAASGPTPIVATPQPSAEPAPLSAAEAKPEDPPLTAAIPSAPVQTASPPSVNDAAGDTPAPTEITGGGPGESAASSPALSKTAKPGSRSHAHRRHTGAHKAD